MDISSPSTPFMGEQALSAIRPIFSGQIPDVPPELWAMVAVLSKRDAVAHLCAVSYAFYALFSPILYNMSIEPPLTTSQSSLLIKTLSKAHTSPFKPHPATFIRSLVVPEIWWNIEAQECHAALTNLYFTPDSEEGLFLGRAAHRALKWVIDLYFPSDGQATVCGSALRTLAWNLESGTDELATILRKPGCFPNLKEISVQCRSDASFDVGVIP